MTGGSLNVRQIWRVRGDIYSLILFTVVAFRSTQRVQALVNAEGIALSSFRNAIASDPNGVFENWNTSDATPCRWTGVTCDNNFRVVRLFLNDEDLTGTISGSLGQLSLLRTLSLSQNSLSGSIPSELSNIDSLYKLNLSLNALSGPVPGALGNLSGMRMLDLSGNLLSGPLPSQLFDSCGKLRFIDLSQNSLSGIIPTNIGSCSDILEIDFSNNNLQGSIPAELGSLSQLFWLSLEQNYLSGRIPRALSNCLALEYLNLGTNSLSGNLPMELAALSNLSSLGVYENFLTGTVSAKVVYMPSMLFMNLSSNSFSGEIPVPDSSNCRLLEALDLSSNNFSGPIPPSLGECSQLLSLRLSSNHLSLPIPTSLGQLANLNSLDLSFNYLNGTLPAQIENLSELTTLMLVGNPISGPIPRGIGVLGKLQVLNLQNMSLNGSLPSSLINLVSLSTLDVSFNELIGSIPEGLSTLSNLTVLDLSSNMLNGSIPSMLGTLTNLQDLDLSNNSFTGPIPLSLGALSNLTSFNVSYNNLTGLIPRTGVLTRFNATSFLGNPGLCGSPLNVICGSFSPLPSPAASQSPGAIGRKTRVLSSSSIIAISAAAFIALAVLLVTLMNVRAISRRRNSDVLVYESSPPSPDISPIVGKLVLFSKSLPSRYEDWEAGTKALLDRDCMVGKGSLGTVYKATFEGGLSIAVKKLETLGRIKNQEEFEHEMGLLGNLKPHPNLVPLQGYYWASAMQLLVTDFIPNGSLFHHLHQQSGVHNSLSWDRRFKVALGTARGLAYLHHDCKPPILHFDLKVSNILLDDNFEPRVTDYGLGKLLPMLDTYISSRKFHTTLGYVAPELACQSLRLTEKCDVYSFGMILLELVTGRQPVESFENSVIVLGEFVRNSLEQGGRVSTCIDPRLENVPESEIMQVLKLGLICTSQIPSKRPTMAEVVQVLESIKSSSNSSRTGSTPNSGHASASGSVAASP